jgi:ketosteroid isomerase-like protein
MKRSPVVLMLVALAALPLFPVTAATVNRQAALDSLVAAEKAFAKAAAEKGTREAFLQYLADESVVLAPDPVPGKETWKARPDPHNFLSWYPVRAEISQAGDLGWDTGPWQLRPKGKNDKTVLHGFFVSVWRKQADGTFKVEYDGGTNNAAPPADLTAVKIAKAVPAQGETPPTVDSSLAQRSILSTEHDFAKAAATKGTAAAYEAFLVDDSRLHHDGAFPVVSKAEIVKTLQARKPVAIWTPLLARVSSSGDLGYALDKGTLADKAGYFARIWRKQGNAWKLVLEVFSPLPPPSSNNPHRKSMGHP